MGYIIYRAIAIRGQMVMVAFVMSKCFACILQPTAPPSLLEMLNPYLDKHPVTGLQFFLSTSFEVGAFFVEFQAVQNEGDRTWRIALPPQYILAIAESGEEAPMGFLAGKIPSS